MIICRIFKRMICLYFLFFSTLCHAYEYELSLCAIFQNEDRFLSEWIDYHRHQGVEHFFLYNNNSEDDYLNVLSPYIEQGIVELIDWPSTPVTKDFNHFCYEVQSGAYNDALRRSYGISKWLAIIDTDEFLLPIWRNNLIELLREKNEYSQIQFPWLLFGTSGIKRIPDNDSMLKLLLWRGIESYEGNNSYKSIVKPEKVMNCTHPHYCNLLNAEKSILLDRREARINHYWTRDEEFLNTVKIKRHEVWGGRKRDILFQASKLNYIYDDLILKKLGN